MTKLELKANLPARLRVIRDRYTRGLAAIDQSKPDIAASHKMALTLQWKVGQAVERWIETVKHEDTALISNALLAVSTDLLESGLRAASNDPAQRSVIASRYLQRFMSTGIESGLLVLPDMPRSEPTEQDNAPKRTIYGPNGEPL